MQRRIIHHGDTQNPPRGVCNRIKPLTNDDLVGGSSFAELSAVWWKVCVMPFASVSCFCTHHAPSIQQLALMNLGASLFCPRPPPLCPP